MQLPTIPPRSCLDTIQIHAHLRTATISETARNDDIICAATAGEHIANRHPHAVDQLWEEHIAVGPPAASVRPLLDAEQRDTASRIRINNRRAILSSGQLLAVHLRYDGRPDGTPQAVSAKADFRFLKKGECVLE